MKIAQPLTQAQMMVLSLVNNSYSDKDLNDLRNTLLHFNHLKMQNHLDNIISKNQINADVFDQILNSHDRKTK